MKVNSKRLLHLVSLIYENKEWLYKEIDSLGGKSPIDLLKTKEGCKLVEQVIKQIEYGIYS